MVLLETKKLTFTYPDEPEPVLKELSFTVNQGELIVIAGPTGSGKSTLLRLFKQEIAPFGKMTGDILYEGTPLYSLDKEKAAREIGMIFQDPENQLVMDRVLNELAFGMENLGMDTVTMRKKVAELAHYFGIHSLLNKPIHELSGGQKQLVNLASILLMEPKILLLDEPTAQLDPVAAKDFLHMLDLINKEFGITIIMVEHHLDEILPICDRLLVLSDGKISFVGNPREVIESIWQREKEPFSHYLPQIPRLFLHFHGHETTPQVPLTVREGRDWIKKISVRPKEHEGEDTNKQMGPSLVEARNIVFQYEKEGERIFDHLDLVIREGEFLAIVGANGTGKSTLLKLLAGLETPQKGKILYRGRKLAQPQPQEIYYMPQNPKLLFTQDTVRQPLENILRKEQNTGIVQRLQELIDFFRIKELLDRHPFDLSGGELQTVALLIVLSSEAKLLLLDEPTKGMDPVIKEKVGNLLKHLQKNGVTIIIATHDIEFAAAYSSRCAMLFHGAVTASGETSSFFKGNTFYTTAINRVTRNSHVPEVTTLEEAKRLWKVVETL
ncbi:MAG: ATP-binding cassette domain-containing protein [Caldibacillus sp.]